jgi:hypothetical protein
VLRLDIAELDFELIDAGSPIIADLANCRQKGGLQLAA